MFAVFGTRPFCHSVGTPGEVSMRARLSHHVDPLSTQVSLVTRICLASLNSAFGRGGHKQPLSLFFHTRMKTNLPKPLFMIRQWEVGLGHMCLLRSSWILSFSPGAQAETSTPHAPRVARVRAEVNGTLLSVVCLSVFLSSKRVYYQPCTLCNW